ncbi:MAG: endonuclease III [Parachlamydiales bacterium]|jgi:endonuclease-3
MKNKRALLVKKILNKYFPDPKITLHHKNLYTFLIAIVLSAQASDVKVNEITSDLFKKAKTPEEMLKFSESKLKKIIKPIGLSNRKTKAVLELSKILIQKYNSRVHSTFEELESLPGVGHKTASVIMSQGFKKDAFPVDTHIQRCARRWGLSKGKNVKEIEEDLKRTFPKKDWHKLHLQIIHFGREYCKAKGHIVQNCPMCKEINR